MDRSSVVYMVRSVFRDRDDVIRLVGSRLAADVTHPFIAPEDELLLGSREPDTITARFPTHRNEPL
jgi:hypothetical protein